MVRWGGTVSSQNFVGLQGASVVHKRPLLIIRDHDGGSPHMKHANWKEYKKSLKFPERTIRVRSTFGSYSNSHFPMGSDTVNKPERSAYIEMNIY